mgnify:CR=1 FL=1
MLTIDILLYLWFPRDFGYQDSGRGIPPRPTRAQDTGRAAESDVIECGRPNLQVLRIGEICIGTTPCETFAETGLEFRKRSPFPQSFMVELANGYYGYMPTSRHFELGGYETWAGTNYIEPQASVKVMDALLEMAGEVAPKSK